MNCYECERPIKRGRVVCAVILTEAEWPEIRVVFLAYRATDGEPVRPVCDGFFPLCSASCCALWWSRVHQMQQDRLGRGQAIPLEAVLRVH